jgi:DNA-binding transcriptional LysR family regulator
MEGMDLRQVDLNLLVAFERVLTLGSVTLAAKDLGVTQPAMSRTLQRLRDSLGDPLFVKVGRSLVATDRARGLQEPLTEALQAVGRVLEPPPTFDPGTATGPFTLALGDEAQLAFVETIVKAIWAQAPGVDVRVRPLALQTLEDSRRGIVDVAICPEFSALPGPKVDLSELVQKKLYTRRFVVVRSRRFPKRLTLAQYAAASHALVAGDGSGRGFIDEMIEPLGYRRRVAATVTTFPVAARLVASSDLVATLPDDVVRTSGLDLVWHPPPFAIPHLPVLLLWHPRRTPDARHRFLRGLVHDAVVALTRDW